MNETHEYFDNLEAKSDEQAAASTPTKTKTRKVRTTRYRLVRGTILLGVACAMSVGFVASANYVANYAAPYSPIVSEAPVKLTDTLLGAESAEKYVLDLRLEGYKPGQDMRVEVIGSDGVVFEANTKPNINGKVEVALAIPADRYSINIDTDGEYSGTFVQESDFDKGNIVLHGKYSYPDIQWEVIEDYVAPTLPEPEIEIF